MSIARHHAEWLSLVEASGPFLSLQVLVDAFPQGLVARDADRFRVLRQAYEEWLDHRDRPDIHRAWVEWVLAEVLDWSEAVLLEGQQIPAGLRVDITEYQVVLRPDWAIAGCDRVLAGVLHSKYWFIGIYDNQTVFSHALSVFAFDSFSKFSILESFIHEVWARQYSGSLETRLRYTPSDCFESFPFPENTDTLEPIGETYYTHRQTIMQTCQEGLTKTYNRFHDPNETDPDIPTLRDLHIQMDTAAAAYGWHDLTLNHDFHKTKQGLRFTISEAARREVLDRLLELNHQRYAEEVAQGLHDKKKKSTPAQKRHQTKTKAKPTPDTGKYTIQGTLIPDNTPTQGELF